MKNINLRISISAICILSILTAFTKGVGAAPIRFDQVVQVVDARPSEAQSPNFSSLALANGFTDPLLAVDDDETKKQQDERVITTTKSDIVKDDVCDCVQPVVAGGGFPKWALLGLAAIPIAFIIIHHHKESPTPTPRTTPTPFTTPTPTPTPGTPTPTPTSTPGTPTPTPMTPTPTPGTPTPTPTMTPGMTPTPTPATPTPTPATPTPTPMTPTPTPGTPTPTPTMTPQITPTPTPPEVPEPISILLFGTGLASIGLAARRKFGKKDREGEGSEEN